MGTSYGADNGVMLVQPDDAPAYQSTDVPEELNALAEGFPARYKIVLACTLAFIICNMVRASAVNAACYRFYLNLTVATCCTRHLLG
jgi:hypothetical protein